MDGRLRNPILGKILREEKQDCVSPSRPNKAEQKQLPEPKQNARMTRVLVVEPDYLPDSEVLAFSRVYTP
jgi:hypothetical protein